VLIQGVAERAARLHANPRGRVKVADVNLKTNPAGCDTTPIRPAPRRGAELSEPPKVGDDFRDATLPQGVGGALPSAPCCAALLEGQSCDKPVEALDELPAL
jgi:hypothetical protein